MKTPAKHLAEQIKQGAPKTCGGCPHLALTGVHGAAVASCGQTGTLVPHRWVGDKREFTFWRIPAECPRTDVVKLKEPAPRKDWVRVVVPDHRAIQYGDEYQCAACGKAWAVDDPESPLCAGS